MIPVCPACNEVHAPWSGKEIHALFLDGSGGFFQNTREFELVCPTTEQVIIGTKTTTGDNANGSATSYRLRVRDAAEIEVIHG